MTNLHIRPLKTEDHHKAIQFAIQGMNFQQYMDNTFLRQAYGRYFWYMEMARATDVIAAYEGKELAGVLLVEMKGRPKIQQAFFKKLYVTLFKGALSLFSKNGSGLYDHINQKLKTNYQADYKPDGEIVFLAANPNTKTRGIGSFLLAELEKRYPNKEIYLYTDSNCTYQFYEKRGFERHGEQETILDLGKHTSNLTCFLYRKRLADLPND